MTTTTSNPTHVVIDANVIIAICAKEVDKLAVANAQIRAYLSGGSRFFSPGVVISESLFVLCKKLENGELTPAEHQDAITAFIAFMGAVDPPAKGDRYLIRRAEDLRGTLSARRSADGIYLALAEELSAIAPTELVTFDSGMQAQANANSLSVPILVLKPSLPTSPNSP